MPISLPQQNLTLTQSDRIFIDLVNNRITMYGQIPYTVPEPLIIDIIKESARLFYRYSWRATSKIYYRLEKTDIDDFTEENPDPNFAKVRGYSVNLPAYVNVVYEIYETNKASYSSTSSILENLRIPQRITSGGGSVIGINNSLYIQEAVARIVEETALKSILGTCVPFSYNPSTYKLQIKQEVRGAIILETLANVNIQIFYNDDLFIRHVIGRTKQELKRKIGGHTIELPGGVTLNVDEICNNIEDVEKVEEILKNGSGIGDIILSRD